MKLHRQSDFTTILLWMVILWTISIATALAQNVTSIPADLKVVDMQKAASSMDVTLGKSTILRLPSPVSRISIGNPNVIDIKMLNQSEVYILGKMIGTTNIILWTRAGQTKVVDVTVLMDAAALQAKLQEIMPEEKEIKVMAAGDSLVLSGTVSDTTKVDRAVTLADAYLRTSVLGMMMGMQSSGYGVAVEKESKAKDGTEQTSLTGQMGQMQGMQGMQGMQILRQGMQTDENSAGAGAGLGSIKIVNLLRVRDNQQVMLEVKVAEVNRTIAEKLGFDFARAAKKAGSAWTQVMAGVIGGGAANLLTAKNLNANINLGLPRVTNATFEEATAFLIDAEKRDKLVKILAEPNIVSISGQEASFLVGGEILIPIPSANQVRLLPKEFGIGVRFTPTVLEEGRIHLRVSPEVSELVEITNVASTGLGQVLAVPTFTTRRVSTTVQLSDGQSLVIGGLLQDNFKEQVKRFPVLGEVPILGTLFRSSDFQADKTELMIVVTPRLVKPLEPDYPLPTDAFITPERGEFLIHGKMESASEPAQPARIGFPQIEHGGFQMK
ncbi:type II and III secretion system protein family protein [Nitrosomonas sp. Nm33]|uniref:type II and III secretion system protein family protein n=1 Tax=Nitrosomonas sp. Nm33 TaxID=133724 RepID=UPI00089AA862|nr:type II and III secretion system protein family protein [Nitrosomonas sp. Nm33]SDY03302.1 pilus assembly protein CpaC [Nitrosomonas sp. Nm33]